MKQRRGVAAVALPWLLAALLGFLGRPAAAAPAARDAALLVTVAQATPALVAALARDHDLRMLDCHALAALELDVVEFAVAPGADPQAMAAALAVDPRVEAAQVMRHHRVAGRVPRMPVKDPYYDLQMRTERRAVETLVRHASGRGVRVAVIDTGIDMAHPDLAGQITEAINFAGGDPATIPAEFHGTAVAGLIVARPGNGIGIHGLAADAELFALRACWEPHYAIGLCSTDTLARALDYAIDVRARIINLSLAGPEDPLLERLVSRAIELGAVVIGAVGEEPGQAFPTSIPGVIAVEQSDPPANPVAGARLAVPGLQLLTTVPDGRYDFVSGPSFAAAHASGVAAVMLDLQPHLGAAELVDWLQRVHGNPVDP
ncbi:MAG: S8 family serine peptidase [Gammaproteobacteria bacterium]|nr:S8 family serine peptidase [Gammaproteobacteria bacterium]